MLFNFTGFSQAFPSLYQLTVLPQGLTDRIFPIHGENGCDLSFFVNDRTGAL